MNKKVVVGIISSILAVVFVVLGYFTNYFRNDLELPNKFIIYLFYILGSVSTLVAFGSFMTNSHKLNIREMVMISIQAAISVLLYYFVKFKLPIFPSWLDIQISEVPALITSYIYGPVSGILVILIRFFVKLPGTMTMGVGEFSDLLLGVCLVGISGFIYRKNRTLKGAVMGLIIAMLISTGVAMLANWLILIPAYTKIAGWNYEALVKLTPKIDGLTVETFMKYYIFVFVLPFNLLRYFIVFIVTFLLYKKLHQLIEKLTGEREVNTEIKEEGSSAN